MASKWFRNFFLLLLSAFLCVGFRVYPGINGWGLDPNSTSGRKVFITLIPSGKALTNNLPGTDTLGSSGSTLTESQLLQSVIDDYNSIQKSYLLLALDSDSDYSANSQNRRIEIDQGSAAGQSSGEAQPSILGKTITGCKIILTDKAFENAKAYVGLVTHELGHCIGLEHPQETVWSVMSYFYQEDVYRLAIDDKMGIVHLYPKNPADAQEKATLGFACSRQ